MIIENKEATYKEVEVGKLITEYSKSQTDYIKRIDAYTKKLQAKPSGQNLTTCKSSLIKSGVLTKSGNTRKIIK